MGWLPRRNESLDLKKKHEKNGSGAPCTKTDESTERQRFLQNSVCVGVWRGKDKEGGGNRGERGKGAGQSVIQPIRTEQTLFYGDPVGA